MPTNNARGHVIPSGGDQTIKRSTIFETFANSIRDIVTAATATARAQIVTALTAVNQGPTAARPLTVYRGDAPGMHRLESTVNGTVWVPASGVMTFATKAAADSFATSNGGLLSVGDECLAGGVRFRWSGTSWYLPASGGVASAGTDASGYVVITHGMGKAPTSVAVTIAADSPVIPHRLTAGVDAITATTFRVTIWRRDNDTILASNPVKFYWAAVA